MSNTLVFRLVDKGAQWVTMDSRGGQLGQVRTDDLHILSVAARQYRLFLLVPGADVLVTSARVPLKIAAKTLKAVP